MYIVIAILVFGILVAIHEFGHFIVAKSCGVRVNEFAIGMGPALLKKQGEETQYSLRLLPIGGFCAMEGEDEESDDPRAFTSQKPWKRFLILCAGSAMNFLFGFLVIVILYSGAKAFTNSEIAYLEKEFPYGGENGLMVGDRIISINDEWVYTSGDFLTFVSRAGDKPMKFVIERDGERITLNDFPLKMTEYDNNGEKELRYGISFGLTEATFGTKLKYSCYTAANFVRNVRIGLTDLITGNAGVKDMSGVVGIVDTINEVGESSETTRDAIENIAYLCAFIAINLAVMNILPIPALDGGRIFLLIVTAIIEKITKKKIDPKYEGYIHGAGFVLLLVLMGVVMVNDVVRIING